MADEAQDVIENAEPTAETSSVENETAEVETEAKSRGRNQSK
jgi:hypothetical protein